MMRFHAIGMISSLTILQIMTDDQLHRLLREAPSESSVPDSFGREVWARIEAEDPLTFTACIRHLLERLFAWLARPVPALATVSACLALGVFFGVASVRSEFESENVASDELSYVHSISPLHQHFSKEGS